LDSVGRGEYRSSTRPQISHFLLAALRCPATHRRLVAHGLELVPEGRTRPTYRLVHGIPLLIPERGSLSEQERQIVRAFATRSVSYYSDNYSAPTSERAARYRLVEHITRPIVEHGMLIADVGAGPGVFAELMGGLGARYVAVDLSIDNLLAAQRRIPEVEAVVATATSLPFRDAVFDVVLATGCLEYIEGQQTVIEELMRVTKPGGYVIVSFANALSPRRWWDERFAHPVLRLIKRFVGNEDTYVRRLTRPESAIEWVRRACGEVRDVSYIGQGVVGYPLSALPYVRGTVEGRGQPRLVKLAAEFVILAQRAAL
jgi:ubiquinone/menaquinone biosynthesis C-methylase UbiE